MDLADVTFATALRVQVVRVLPYVRANPPQKPPTYEPPSPLLTLLCARFARARRYSQAFDSPSFRAYLDRKVPGGAEEFRRLSASRAGAMPLDLIVSSINGISTERTNTNGVQQILASEIQKGGRGAAVSIVFKSSSGFNDALAQLGGGETASTTVSPESATAPKKEVAVTQIAPPNPAATSVASPGDLLEIEYRASFLPPGGGELVPFDGSGRGGDTSVSFVLKKQPFGQFPPAMDVGLVGARPGEQRRVRVPPELGYGDAGFPKMGIPGGAQLEYEVKLHSVNGVFL
jgi:hypothetical protein